MLCRSAAQLRQAGKIRYPGTLEVADAGTGLGVRRRAHDGTHLVYDVVKKASARRVFVGVTKNITNAAVYAKDSKHFDPATHFIRPVREVTIPDNDRTALNAVRHAEWTQSISSGDRLKNTTSHGKTLAEHYASSLMVCDAGKGLGVRTTPRDGTHIVFDVLCKDGERLAVGVVKDVTAAAIKMRLTYPGAKTIRPLYEVKIEDGDRQQMDRLRCEEWNRGAIARSNDTRFRARVAMRIADAGTGMGVRSTPRDGGTHLVYDVVDHANQGMFVGVSQNLVQSSSEIAIRKSLDPKYHNIRPLREVTVTKGAELAQLRRKVWKDNCFTGHKLRNTTTHGRALEEHMAMALQISDAETGMGVRSKPGKGATHLVYELYDTRINERVLVGVVRDLAKLRHDLLIVRGFDPRIYHVRPLRQVTIPDGDRAELNRVKKEEIANPTRAPRKEVFWRDI